MLFTLSEKCLCAYVSTPSDVHTDTDFITVMIIVIAIFDIVHESGYKESIHQNSCHFQKWFYSFGKMYVQDHTEKEKVFPKRLEDGSGAVFVPKEKRIKITNILKSNCTPRIQSRNKEKGPVFIKFSGD